MATTLSGIRARVREDLQDSDDANYRWSNHEVDGAIERVLREFSQAYPIQQQDEITTTEDDRELDISSLENLSKVVSVEYPMDLSPPYMQRIETWADKLYMSDEGDGTKKARVRWYQWHTLLGDTAWAASTAYALGDIVVPAALNGYWYECTTAGTSGAAAPTWPTTAGGTVDDNTATWTCRASTIPEQLEEIIVLGATGYLAMSASVYTTDKATIAGSHAPDDFRLWGQKRLSHYEKRLKAIARSNRVITLEFYSD